jgi:hypothetical protein
MAGWVISSAVGVRVVVDVGVALGMIGMGAVVVTGGVGVAGLSIDLVLHPTGANAIDNASITHA